MPLIDVDLELSQGRNGPASFLSDGWMEGEVKRVGADCQEVGLERKGAKEDLLW